MSTKLIDLTGQRFGRWTVLEKAPSRPMGSGAYWVCKCDCGNIKQVNSQILRNGRSQSCGCLHYEQQSKRASTHGKSKTRLYNVWAGMRERCYCPSCNAYKYYGAVGITVCDEWKDYVAFERWALANWYNQHAKPHQCTIDRIDNSKGYSPDNCRWVDSAVQANNTSANICISFNGKTQNLSEWCKELAMNYHRTYDRLFRYGWSVERAFIEPPRGWSPGRCKNSE